MSERGLPIVDGAPACPFVAFEDDRDERSTSPDHRHRCYAETSPAPRALAHQEAYCLASAFPVCPTFQDWAHREAARARTPAPGTARPTGSDDAVQRNAPRDWSAPPPWSAGDRPDAPGGPAYLGGASAGTGAAGPAAGAAGAAAGAAGAAGAAAAGPPAGAGSGPAVPTGPATPPPPRPAAPGPDVSAPDFLSDRARPERGLAGSAGDRIAGAGAEPSGATARPARPADAVGRPVVPAAAPVGDDWDDDWEEGPSAGGADRVAAGNDRPRGGLPLGDRRPRVGDSRPRREPEGSPSWERPRKYEAYPTLKTRVGMSMPSFGSVPRIGVMALALVVAAIALFFLPALLGLVQPTTPGAGVGSSPSATAPPPSQSVAPTATPAPTQQTYIVKSGDTLSRIAAQFNISLAELIEANRENLPDPDTLDVGDELIIPAPLPDELPGASGSESASP